MDTAAAGVQDLLVEGEVDEVDLMEMSTEAVNQIDFEDNSTDEDSEVNNLTLKKGQSLNLAENLESFLFNADPSTEKIRKLKGRSNIVYLHTMKSTTTLLEPAKNLKFQTF